MLNVANNLHSFLGCDFYILEFGILIATFAIAAKTWTDDDADDGDDIKRCRALFVHFVSRNQIGSPIHHLIPHDTPLDVSYLISCSISYYLFQLYPLGLLSWIFLLFFHIFFGTRFHRGVCATPKIRIEFGSMTSQSTLHKRNNIFNSVAHQLRISCWVCAGILRQLFAWPIDVRVESHYWLACVRTFRSFVLFGTFFPRFCNCCCCAIDVMILYPLSTNWMFDN